MKSFQAIQEERGEKAFKQAIAMGLKYGGFGYWKDPQSGETKFKTENDTLIPVEPDESSELAGKGGPDSNGMADGQMGGGMMGGGGMGNMMGPGGMLQMPGQQPGSGILGAPEPGEETPEGGERKGWEPGPDGDTCAGPDAQDPADVPKDTYVGTTNYAKWVAGPDGDNMTTVSAASIQEVIEPEPIIEPTQSFETFISEAPMAPMGGTDPKAEAEQLGLEFAGFGWYRDPKTGRRVAKIVGNKLVQYSQDTGTAATTHTGNPTNPASGQTPATKARSMGLQSNGSGGYIDPSTGQVVAKTVNNELVFYDAQGGAISDGSGGEQLTQSAPSWVDPVSGLIIVPPAQPESPEEQAAVPDSTPAQAPMGLDAFFNKRKIELYRQQAGEDAANADIDAQQMEVDELMNMHPGMRELQRQMQGVTDRAMDSDDDDTNERGAMLMDMMNDEAGSYLKYFMMAKDEDKDDIVKEIKTLMIATARADQAQDKLREMGGEPGDEARTEVGLASDEAKGKIERMRDRLDTRHDSNLNIPDAEKLEAGEDYPETMVGDDITYNLNPMKRAPSQRWWEKEANYALRKAGADFRNPQTFVEVNWDVNDTEDKFDTQGNQKRMTGRERKRTALNAVSTWRNDVLPQLQPGMVLMANPLEDSDEKAMNRKDGRNQRERIYQLAGFGKTHDDIMGAVVIRDERGNNKLVPISPTREQQENERKIEENYIRLIGSDLNNLEVEVAYDMLFS
jgi:hypothetical protein